MSRLESKLLASGAANSRMHHYDSYTTQPKYMVHYRICADMIGNELKFYFEQPIPPEKTTMALYLSKIEAARTTHPGAIPPKSPRDNPLDLYIPTPSCVFLELDRDGSNWIFQPSAPAILVQSRHADDYLALNHVINDGTGGFYPTPFLDEAPAANDGTCNLVYFSAITSFPETAAGDRGHPFNIYIQVQQGADHILPLILDPDIKSQGPPPPLRGRGGG